MKGKEVTFPEVCRKFVHEVGKHDLIPSPSIAESEQLRPLHVVTMTKKPKYVICYKKEYSSHDILFSDLLTDTSLIEAEVERSKFCWNYESEWGNLLNVKIGEHTSLNLNFSSKVNVKFEHLYKENISDTDFIAALHGRRLNMNHHFIRQITDTKTVLCVVKMVITADKVKLKRKDKRKVKTNTVIEDDNLIEIASRDGKDMLIELGTTLAYKVWPLREGENNEELIPVMTARQNEGLFLRDRTVLYKRKNTKMLIALAYMTDAILELKTDDLEKIDNCNEPQLKALSKILESAVVDKRTISINKDTSSIVLKEPVSSFLRRLKFAVCEESIQPPKIKSCIVECIFCVVYLFSMKVVLQSLILNFIMLTLLRNYCMCFDTKPQISLELQI